MLDFNHYFLDPMNPANSPLPENPTPEELETYTRLTLRTLIRSIAVFITAMTIFSLICLITGCTVPKAVEEHHHHHYEADTAAVSRQVDERLTSWHTEMEAFFRERLEQFVSQQQQSEHQHETIHETVTVSLDSLGREIRQEQRTISRDISRELQTIEQHLTREYESRLRSTADSLDSAWRMRYDSLQARVAQMDSMLVTKTPVGDARPWYRRWWDAIQYILIGSVIAAAIWLSRRWWWKFVKFV